MLNATLQLTINDQLCVVSIEPYQDKYNVRILPNLAQTMINGAMVNVVCNENRDRPRRPGQDTDVKTSVVMLWNESTVETLESIALFYCKNAVALQTVKDTLKESRVRAIRAVRSDTQTSLEMAEKFIGELEK